MLAQCENRRHLFGHEGKSGVRPAKALFGKGLAAKSAAQNVAAPGPVQKEWSLTIASYTICP